jgi:hypothetical protein
LNSIIFALHLRIFLVIVLGVLLLSGGCGGGAEPGAFSTVSVVAGSDGEFGEPFGIAVRNGDAYVSDGEGGKIFKISAESLVTEFASGFDTPSGIAFDEVGNLIVADPGSNTIKLVGPTGGAQTLAGIEGQRGNSDGEVAAALFNGPVGVEVGANARIFVCDTYNDRIRLIDNGNVSTFAGSSKGFTDGVGSKAQFDTPLGIAVWHDKLLVADAGNRRIRVVEPDGTVWTLAGTGEMNSRDGPLLDSSFVRPTGIAVDDENRIYIADGNSIRVIGNRMFPFVETITDTRRGFRDGLIGNAQFNRPSGLAVDKEGDLLVADSENRVVRRVSRSNAPPESKATPHPLTAEEFRGLQPGRWPFDPPDAQRDVAGTLGEIRGEVKPENARVWFHNGVDIAGKYGEIAFFIRNEKVLDPFAVDNVGTLRELLRMPTVGYIHLRLGRDEEDKPFDDARFLFSNSGDGEIQDIRVPRGTRFIAGDKIGTLNAMNHIHMIAGRSGSEINALAALDLPGASDKINPGIERVELFRDDWSLIETETAESRIKLLGKIRIVLRAFDRMDGNPERRKLGLYRLGYQLFHEDGSPASDVKWTIEFERMPPNDAVRFVYANGSRSGPSGETIFDYIVTNWLTKDRIGEEFFDTTMIEPGNYSIRVFAADIFGNTTSKDIPIEVIR